MKVYFTPIKIAVSGSRLSATEFFHYLINSYRGEADFRSVNKEVKFKFFEDSQVFIVVALTTKELKNFCEGDDTGADFVWKMSGDLTNKIAETNILILSKINFAGAYLHNEGSVRINNFESKLRWMFRKILKNQYGKSKRDEKFSIERLVDSDDILRKVSRLSEIDQINATFTNPTTKQRLNGSVFKDTQSIRVTQRVGSYSLKSLAKRKEISEYLEDLIKGGGGNVSIRGVLSGSLAGETIGVADAVNSIYAMEYSEYISELDGTSLSKFVGSELFEKVKKKVLDSALVQKA
ncbi:hypothetical protein ACQKEN_17230 [Pseudomonas sp. NPDC078416]|uniref:hypothetical protein n=1 Tax=Pseudomonas sp. NPDC078416 TaxID=3390637 RepID=UPI003D02AA71